MKDAFITHLLLLFCSILFAQKAQPPLEYKLFYQTSFNKKANQNGISMGNSKSLYAINVAVQKDSPEKMAAEFLNQHAKTLKALNNDKIQLQYLNTRSSDIGHVVRHKQFHKGIKVKDAETTVHIGHNNTVNYALLNVFETINITDVLAKINEKQALDLAKKYLNVSNQVNYEHTELIIYPDDNGGRLAYETSINAIDLLGEWHVMVDAKTGEIFEALDKALYYCKHDVVCTHDHDHDHDEHSKSHISQSPNSVDGTGFVFDPDPLTLNRASFGGDYVDNNDATNEQLDNSRRLVTLQDIEDFNGIYTLRGPWAEIRDHSAPFKGLFQQFTPDFEFDRSDDAFEAVNVYYHIDSMMRYINETLGINARPSAYVGGVRFDPSGSNGNDVSFYSLSRQQITFGEGCYDDGEDSDIIHHELGHGIHDWLTNGSLSQVDGLSEGLGDYIAQSYNRTLGYWEPSDPQYNWVFSWDGHNDCWSGRVTNTNGTYPSSLGTGVHRNGQIFSTCLMRIHDRLGRERTDKIVLEGISMTNSSSNQNDAAVAIFTAAQILDYTDNELSIIVQEMTTTGYTLLVEASAPIASFTHDFGKETVCPNEFGNGEISFFDGSTEQPESWNWSFSGSANPSIASSSNQNPTITFSNTGIITASLIVSNAAGSDTLTSNINVALYVDCFTNCQTFNSGNLGHEIIASDTDLLYRDTITISGMTGTITDVNITNLNVSHSLSADVDATLKSPSSVEVYLLQGNCRNHADIDIGFDDDANVNITCPLTGGDIYIPLQNLSAFNDSDPNGDWVFTIRDRANLDGGIWNSWEYEVCTFEMISDETDEEDESEVENQEEDDESEEAEDCTASANLTGLVTGEKIVHALSVRSSQQLSSTADVDYNVREFVLFESGFTIDQGAIVNISMDGCK